VIMQTGMAEEMEWTVSWRIGGNEPEDWLTRSTTWRGGAEARAFALEITLEARGGELRIGRRIAGRTEELVYASEYEIRAWRPEHERMPAGIDSAWETWERRRSAAVLIYNRLRRALSEAVAADLIRRASGRRLRVLLRSALLEGPERLYDLPSDQCATTPAGKHLGDREMAMLPAARRSAP